MCDGFRSVELKPSPKSQRYVTGLTNPVDVSLNWTDNGANPEVGVPEKSATGPRGAAVTLI